MTARRPSRLRSLTIPVLLGAALIVSACSTGSESSESTTPRPANAPAFCTEVDAVRAAVNDLKDLNLIREGTDGLRTRVDAVNSALAKLQQGAVGDFQTEIDSLKGAVDEVRAAMDQGVSGLARAGTAIGKVGTAWDAFTSKVRDRCGG